MKVAARLIAMLLFAMAALPVSAEPGDETIYSACYRNAPIVQPKWTLLPNAMLVRIEFSYYESFYTAVNTGQLPGDYTSTTFVGLPEAASLYFRVAHLPASGSWQYGEPHHFMTPSCHAATPSAKVPVAEQEAPGPRVGDVVRNYTVLKPGGAPTLWFKTSLSNSGKQPSPLVCKGADVSQPRPATPILIATPPNAGAASGPSYWTLKPSANLWLLWCSLTPVKD